MATVDRLDFEARRYERFYVAEIQLFEDEDLTDPMDLTGVDLKMQIRPEYNKPAVMELSTSNGRINIVTAASGIIEIDVDAADMTFAAGTYVQDLSIDDSTNKALWVGRWIMVEKATR